MLLPSGNPLKCHEEVFFLQPIVPPKRVGCSEDLDAFRFFFKRHEEVLAWEPTFLPKRFGGVIRRFRCVLNNPSIIVY